MVEAGAQVTYDGERNRFKLTINTPKGFETLVFNNVNGLYSLTLMMMKRVKFT